MNNGNFDLFDDLRDDERQTTTSFADASDFVVDIREYDVPYHVRVMIDLGQSLQSEVGHHRANFEQTLELAIGTL